MSMVDQADDIEGRSGSTPGRASAEHFSGAPPSNRDEADEPAAVGIDLGSGYTRIWAAGRRLLHVPTISGDLTRPAQLIRRGRIIDPAELATFLTHLLRRYHRPLPTGAVVVACLPVLATKDDETVARQLLMEVFDPSRVLFIDTVRAAAIGAAVRPGGLLVADVGAQLTEVAVLARGGVAAARRADLGMNDLIRPSEADPVVHTIVELVGYLRRDPRCRRLAATAVGNGLLIVGGGATQPQLAARTAAALDLPVRPAPEPRLAAVRGAGRAALSALRRAATLIT
jgi:rod shape-determining protein MreB and related proteins